MLLGEGRKQGWAQRTGPRGNHSKASASLQGAERPLEVRGLSKGAGPLHACVSRPPDTGWGGPMPGVVTVGDRQHSQSRRVTPRGGRRDLGGVPHCPPHPLLKALL